jgi:hypothetical protein
LTRPEGHVFRPAAVSLLDGSIFDLADTDAKHLTDLYLLGLAASFQGRLATFDQNIPWQRVAGCSRENLEILA